MINDSIIPKDPQSKKLSLSLSLSPSASHFSNTYTLEKNQASVIAFWLGSFQDEWKRIAFLESLRKLEIANKHSEREKVMLWWY